MLPKPPTIHVEEDGIQDALTRGIVLEAVHRPNPSTYFTEDPLNDIGGADLAPVLLWAVKEGKHLG
jgi:hypothetical protein